jgi:ATP-binding cassette subfamily F protein 3
MMLQVQDLELHFGERTIFNGLSFSIQKGEKVALIGRNGAGKTTLFRMIAGEYRPDKGRLEVPAAWRLGYLSQDIRPVKEETVWEIALSAYDEHGRLEEEISLIEKQLEANALEGKALEDALIRLEDAHHRLHVLGWDQAEGEAEKVLKGLGFTSDQFERQLKTFSGGWQVRAWLAKLLLEKPDFMMLDEPTNHLDIEAILWLEGFLAQSDMALLIVSHDRRFLDASTSRVMELVLGRIDDYNMGYGRYLEERALRMQQRQEAAESQQRKMAQMQATIDRFRAKASKATMAKSMEKQLQKMDPVESFESDDRRMNVRFPKPPRSGEVVFKATQLSKSYGETKVLQNLDFAIHRGDRIALVGQNGQGKTTLARIVAGDLQPDQGELAETYQVHTGYYAQDQSEKLTGNRTVLQTLEDAAGPDVRTQVRAILGAFLFSGEDVDKKVSVLSGGERARLALAKLMLKPSNLLILDEPTNHLDMTAKDVLKKAVRQYDGTLVVVSHDRDFLSGLCDKIYYFRNGTVKPFLGDMDDFLQEQALQDERLLEARQATKNEAPPPPPSSPAPDREALKEARRTLRHTEKEIERLEEAMKKLEAEMGAPDFYERADAADKSARYNQLRQQMQEAESAWEAAVEILGDEAG